MICLLLHDIESMWLVYIYMLDPAAELLIDSDRPGRDGGRFCTPAVPQYCTALLPYFCTPACTVCLHCNFCTPAVPPWSNIITGLETHGLHFTTQGQSYHLLLIVSSWFNYNSKWSSIIQRSCNVKTFKSFQEVSNKSQIPLGEPTLQLSWTSRSHSTKLKVWSLTLLLE